MRFRIHCIAEMPARFSRSYPGRCPLGRPMALAVMALVLASGAGADNAPLPPIDPSAVRVPAPSGIALDRAERRFADAYEVEVADKTEAGRRKFIQTILTDAPLTHDDPAG